MKVKNVASLTITLYDGGTSEAVIMSHPDGNDIEEILKATLTLINATIKQELGKEIK
jgi:hypothetical protein